MISLKKFVLIFLPLFSSHFSLFFYFYFLGVVFIMLKCPAFIIIFIYSNSIIISVIKHNGEDFLLFPFFF